MIVCVVSVVSQETFAERLPEPFLGEHFLGAAGPDEPVGEQYHSITVPSFVQVVCGEDHDRAPPRIFLDQREDSLLAWDVKTGYRLVQEQKFRVRR